MFSVQPSSSSSRRSWTLELGLLLGALLLVGALPVHAQQPTEQSTRQPTVLEAFEESNQFEQVPTGVLRSVAHVAPERLTAAQRARVREARASGEEGIGRSVALSELTVLEDQQRFYGTPWPREDLNFFPSGIGTGAGDVTGDGTDDWIYRRFDVADDRTSDLSDRTPKTLLTFGEGTFSARYYDELYYRNLHPVGNFVGSEEADALRPLSGGGSQVYRGTSSGYQEGSAILPDSVPNSFNILSPVDLNGDGYSEIIVQESFSDQFTDLRVAFGAQDPDSVSVHIFRVPSDTGRTARFRFTSGDVDEDGIGEVVRLQGANGPFGNDDSLSVDVIGLEGSDSLVVRQSNAVDFPQGTTGYDLDLSLANIDGTGRKELVVRSFRLDPGQVYVTPSSGGAFQDTPITYYPGSRPVGDLNGDGRADFALRDTSDQTPYVAFGPSAVGDGLSFDVEMPSGPDSASVFLPSEPQGDLDGDGREELIVEYQTGSQFGPRLLDLPQGASSFETTDFLFDRSAYATDIGVQQTVNVGDWNGDGTDDVGFVRTNGRVEIYYGDPTQAITPDVTLTGPASDYSSVATGDFTGNGTPNLAVAWASDTETIAVYEAGSGDNPVHTIGIEDLGIAPDAPGIADGEDDFPNSTVANLGDVNGDGLDDLGVTQPEVESAAAQKVFLFLGAQSLSGQPDVTVDYSDRGVGQWFGQVLRGVGDINGDGTDDFLVGDTFASFDGGSLFPPDPFGQGFSGALFVHFGDTGSPPAIDDPDQALAVPLVEQVPGDLRINSFFGFQGLAVGDFNGDDTTDVAAKPGFSRFNSTSNGALIVRVFHGGSDFDGVPDAELPVPGVLDFFSDTRLAGLNFAAVTALPPASSTGPNRLVIETWNPSNALIYGPGPDTSYTLEMMTLLRGPDQNSGLGVGHPFINIPQNGASATGDFNGNGQANLVLPQLQSADFRGAPAYTYELGQGIREEPSPVATSSQPVDSTSGTVDFGNGTGVDIAFSDSTTGADSVTVERFDQGPDGATGISESNVSSYRVEISAGEGLSVGDSTEVRFDVSMLAGIDDPTRVTIYVRELAGVGAFHAVPTTYDDSTNELVGLVSGFSEFAFASDTEPLPVELAGFEATVEDETVRLTWQTASETGNARFEVQRRVGERANGGEGAWTTVGSVEGSGTTTEAQSYRFVDSDLPYAADRLDYRLKQVDTDGSAQFSETVTVERTVDEVELLGTYPNPAQSQATVRYALPKKQEVSLTLYDVLGRQVRTVVQAEKKGRHERRLDTSALPSGVYFLRLRAGGQTRTQKLTVVR